MIKKKHLEKLSPHLKQILNLELALGNEVTETSEGWPEESSIIIILKQPFKKDHKSELLEFRDIKDPHYWKSEYFDKSTGQILACKF